ncbi:MAG: hypothetical protein V3U23_07890 [Kiloniellales bacterium]
MLNGAQVAQYHEAGYVVPEFRLPDDTLAEIRAAHDLFLVHGSDANASAKPRRGMTLRFMPTTSVFDRDLAGDLYRRIGTADHSRRTLFLMRGQDRSGRNDFVLRH